MSTESNQKPICGLYGLAVCECVSLIPAHSLKSNEIIVMFCFVVRINDKCALSWDERFFQTNAMDFENICGLFSGKQEWSVAMFCFFCGY